MFSSFFSIVKNIYKTQKEVFIANRFLYLIMWFLSIISGLLPILNSFFWMQLVNNFIYLNNRKIYIIVISMSICSCVSMILQGSINNLSKLQSEYFNKYNSATASGSHCSPAIAGKNVVINIADISTAALYLLLFRLLFTICIFRLKSSLSQLPRAPGKCSM